MKKIIVLFGLTLIGLIFIGAACSNQSTKDSSDNQQNYTTSINPGENVPIIKGKLTINVSDWPNQTVKFYNTKINNKNVYFFVVKDNNGVIHAAGNACQVCFSTKKGFHQEGNEIVCNNCGNRYTLERIATEKGGCNPIPISPNIPVNNGKILITSSQINQISDLF